MRAVRLYGPTFQMYPGEYCIPTKLSADRVLDFRSDLYCIDLYAKAWQVLGLLFLGRVTTESKIVAST